MTSSGITRTVVLALIGLMLAAGLSYGVSVATSEQSLLSGASRDDGLELAPGDLGIERVRTPEDKPVVVRVGPGGKAVVQSQGGPPLIPAGSGNSSDWVRKARSQDD